MKTLKQIALAVLAVAPLAGLAFVPVDLDAPAYNEMLAYGIGFWLVAAILHPINAIALLRSVR